MSIKTTSTGLNPASQPAAKVAGKNGSPGADRDSGSLSAPGDTVTFTQTAAELLKLEETLAALPEVDSARVAAVRAAISDGTYQVDAEKIVDRLLGVEKDIAG